MKKIFLLVSLSLFAGGGMLYAGTRGSTSSIDACYERCNKELKASPECASFERCIKECPPAHFTNAIEEAEYRNCKQACHKTDAYRTCEQIRKDAGDCSDACYKSYVTLTGVRRPYSATR